MRTHCAGDGPITRVKLYLEYNRKIFQLILHWDPSCYLTRRTTPSQAPCTHDPACKAVHRVSVEKQLQYLPIVFHADPSNSNTASTRH